MVANNPSQKKPDFDKAETVERLNQVRHMQTLRWAYLSTYLAAIGWFTSEYLKTDSTLTDNPLITLLLSVVLAILGGFLGWRIFHFTKIIRHDLTEIGTSIPARGWLEYSFVFLLTLMVFVFGILVYFGVI